MTRTTTTQTTVGHQPDEASRGQRKGQSIKACLVLALLLVLCSLVGTVETASTATLSANAAGSTPVAPPAISTSSPDPAADRGASNIDPDAAAATASQRGISIAEATARLQRQQALGAQGAQTERSLAGRSGGTYLDSDGSLVVTTLDPASAALVTRNGARAQLVDDSSARLDSIMKRLDKQASQGRAGAVQGWYVDVPTNTVVVTVTEGATDSNTVAMTKLATSFGDTVRIEYRSEDEAPQSAEYLVGGFEFVLPNGGTCSVGFNTLDAFNRNVVLTAGHCVKTNGTLSRNGYWIGAARTANFPTDDFGTFWNSYPSYWQPSTSVYKYNGTYATVAGQWDNPPVGATVCKSGRTTGYTCGTITALNQTVTYKDGSVLYGLVRHNACVEPGDSGGSNISAGRYALGVTSGSITSLNTGKCLSKSGGANVGWYQPIGEALTANGLRLLF